MKTIIKAYLVASSILLIGISSCKKEEYSFGDLTAPTGLAVKTTVQGVDNTNPFGNGSGKVTIAATCSNALSYNIDFGDGTKQSVVSGNIMYKYSNPGTTEYTITVNAIGKGGSTSTITKKVKVFVNFTIPANIVAALTNGTLRTWITDKAAVGHVGVGPADQFAPIWYEAPPNGRDACLYDDEVTFSKDANDNISMVVDNKGQTFIIAAATAYYGLTGGDGCYNISTGGIKKLNFMDATSATTSANSTRIQFTVPGNGIVNFATGGTTYEILALTPTTVQLRNIGADGNAWYQKLKVK